MLLHFQLTWGLLGNLCSSLFNFLGGKLPNSPRSSWSDLIFRAASACEAQSKKSRISFLHASSRNSFCFQQAIIIDISVIQVASGGAEREDPQSQRNPYFPTLPPSSLRHYSGFRTGASEAPKTHRPSPGAVPRHGQLGWGAYWASV